MDDQHGTAIVVAAAFINALKVVGKELSSVRAVLNGAGSAGIAIGKHLMNLGLKNLIMVDRFGIIDEGMEELNPAQAEMAELTNREHKRGTLADALQGAGRVLRRFRSQCADSRDDQNHGCRSDRFRYGQTPHRKSCLTPPKPPAREWWALDAAIFPIRSTMSWRFRGFSAALWTAVPPASTRK